MGIRERGMCPWYNLDISPKYLKTLSNILKKSSTIVNQIFKNHPKKHLICKSSKGGVWGQPDPRLREVGAAGSPGGRAPPFADLQMICCFSDDFWRFVDDCWWFCEDIGEGFEIFWGKIKKAGWGPRNVLKNMFFSNRRDLSDELRLEKSYTDHCLTLK